MKRIVVMTPKYSDYEINTKRSIKRAIHYLPYELIFLSVSEVYIHAGRRKLLTKALELHNEEPFDYFLWLDSDIEFEPNDINLLTNFIDSKGDIISGLYFNRHGCNNPMACIGNPHEGYKWDIVNKLGDIQTIDACGFGFIMFSTKSILNYTSNYQSTIWFQSDDWYPKIYQEKERIFVFGEDLYFCENIKKLGYKIYLDTNILLKHREIGIENWLKNKSSQLNKCNTHCLVKIENFSIKNNVYYKKVFL